MVTCNQCLHFRLVDVCNFVGYCCKTGRPAFFEVTVKPIECKHFLGLDEWEDIIHKQAMKGADKHATE